MEICKGLEVKFVNQNASQGIKKLHSQGSSEEIQKMVLSAAVGTHSVSITTGVASLSLHAGRSPGAFVSVRTIGSIQTSRTLNEDGSKSIERSKVTCSMKQTFILCAIYNTVPQEREGERESDGGRTHGCSRWSS